MIGDHIEWDVAAPQRLGLRGIWVDRERAGLPRAPPCVPTASSRNSRSFWTRPPHPNPLPQWGRGEEARSRRGRRTGYLGGSTMIVRTVPR